MTVPELVWLRKTCSPKISENSRQTETPRTLLPCSSSRGEKTPMPSCPGNDGDDAAADAALRRQADLVRPFAGIVVHAAGVHHAEHDLDVLAAAAPLAGHRIDAAIGERRGHDGEIGGR